MRSCFARNWSEIRVRNRAAILICDLRLLVSFLAALLQEIEELLKHFVRIFRDAERCDMEIERFLERQFALMRGPEFLELPKAAGPNLMREPAGYGCDVESESLKRARRSASIFSIIFSTFSVIPGV